MSEQPSTCFLASAPARPKESRAEGGEAGEISLVEQLQSAHKSSSHHRDSYPLLHARRSSLASQGNLGNLGLHSICQQGHLETRAIHAQKPSSTHVCRRLRIAYLAERYPCLVLGKWPAEPAKSGRLRAQRKALESAAAGGLRSYHATANPLSPPHTRLSRCWVNRIARDPGPLPNNPHSRGRRLFPGHCTPYFAQGNV